MTSRSDTTRQSSERLSLKRWSRRKLDAARAQPAATPAATVPPAPAAATPPMPAPTTTELPPIGSLTVESDFSAFFQPQVDEVVKRAALKQLFRDPRFNVMDGLDTYIDDYTRADPIPDEVLKQLVQARAIFDPPKTEITPEGYVVDVPAETRAVESEPAPPPLEAPAEPQAAAAPAAPVPAGEGDAPARES